MPLRRVKRNGPISFCHVTDCSLGSRGRLNRTKTTIEKVLYGDGKLSGSTRELMEGEREGYRGKERFWTRQNLPCFPGLGTRERGVV